MYVKGEEKVGKKDKKNGKENGERSTLNVKTFVKLLEVVLSLSIVRASRPVRPSAAIVNSSENCS